jgi:PAS domain S-box-containing protein
MTEHTAEFARNVLGAEAEETLHAIRTGAVDAFVVEEPEGHKVYALEECDLPYSVLVERMQQGAAMLDSNGDIIYCNASLVALLGVPHEKIIGTAMQRIIDSSDELSYEKLLNKAQSGSSEGEMRLRRADGTLIPANFAFRLLVKDKSSTGVLITDLRDQKQQLELTSRIQQMQDEEGRRIARELHDSVGQSLVALGMNISTIKKDQGLSPEAVKLLNDNEAMIAEINREIRTISHLLHPPLLDEMGLSSALGWYIDGFTQRSSIKTTLDIPQKLRRLPPNMEIAIFRTVQEGLTNVHRHSASPSCAVTLLGDGDKLRLEIRDSGRGMPSTKQLTSSPGVGLRGMKERFRQLGGSLEIESTQEGTVVRGTLTIPIEK